MGGLGSHDTAREGAKTECIAAKALWREFVAGRYASSSAADVRIGVGASFTADTLTQFIGSQLVSQGFTPEITVGPYNQLIQICLEPQAYFGAGCDAIALLWLIDDFMYEDVLAFLDRDINGLAKACEKVTALAGAIANLRSIFPGTIIVSVPPAPATIPVDLLSLDYATTLGAFHRTVAGRFVEAMQKLQDIRLIDLDAVQRQVGFSSSFDSRQLYLYRQPFSDTFLHRAGVQISRIIVAARCSAKKCIVVDCDNTLWGGIVGEDGLDGLELGDDYPGSAYRDFQRLLRHWRRQGIFIALLSKNNEADVWEAFDRHSGMVLKRSDISAWQINWLPKAENMALIAEALNIGIDSLVFVDDNPMEIAYMQKAQPHVTSILLPDDPAEIVPALRKLTFFDRLETTDEDIARVDMMRAEQERKSLGVTMSTEQFLREINLKIDLFVAQPEDLARVTQLVNKTNQFNLTTIRRTLDEVRSLANKSTARVYGLRVSDKYGDYGLTGVIVVEVSADRRIWSIDTLLLSCRVLGRGVETGLLAALADDAAAAGAAEFAATLIPTKKNELVATFLPDHGFKLDGGVWRLPIAEAPRLPEFIERLGSKKLDQIVHAA